ncbi:hypothetical protein B0G76_8622 [Paraburkholderia sp. BL23I1N1]|uniref:hypothetical protein n=1 Tax=Paraburkholderia sp. BL23I1N1 TaxID=1938802 RepID=UPI000FEE0C59|nr:hypothetical protein [Paraburkholderia sp. BL23I1N1]RKE23922.1 hypothetical protein B0G76_8622 [Paraburkholderia sp. BL23I1N1]
MKLTSGKLLDLMEAGRTYRASELAECFDTSTAQVNDMLCTLVEAGFVRMNSHSSRILRFERLSFEPDPPSRAAVDTNAPATVAIPPVTRTQQGSPRGYEASLASVRSLAMAARHSSRG